MHAAANDATALCRRCGRGAPSHPRLSGPPAFCSDCWIREQETLRRAPPISLQFIRKGPSVCEYGLARQGESVGRLILYRDSTTLCVRFLSRLNGESELVLEEIFARLGVARSPDLLDVHVIHAQGETARAT